MSRYKQLKENYLEAIKETNGLPRDEAELLMISGQNTLLVEIVGQLERIANALEDK